MLGGSLNVFFILSIQFRSLRYLAVQKFYVTGIECIVDSVGVQRKQ